MDGFEWIGMGLRRALRIWCEVWVATRIERMLRDAKNTNLR
jgi:hypothetical protein